MKQNHIFLILFLAAFLFACTGGNYARKKPEHLTFGMGEVQKGMGWYQKGCYNRSLEHFFKAHEFFSVSDQLNGAAMSLNNIANVYRVIGEINNAVFFYKESYALYSDIKDYKGVVQALSNMAAALIDASRLEEAEKIMDQADEIAMQIKILFLPIQKNRGILLVRKKEFARAEEILKSVLKMTDPENLSEFAAVNFALGNLMFETGRYEEAIGFLKVALEADRSSGFYSGIAEDLAAIGDAYFIQAKYEPAAKFFKRSIKVYALTENEKKVKEWMEQLEKASEKADLDISVTKYFVNSWLDGKALVSPCKPL
ncbi:MAG: tetratricopeptide repeat protein [Deltaproteobacteria bacterium]|nr:tetratricopeptide repeat protein [Deltaproteobacteria bacterium]